MIIIELLSGEKATVNDGVWTVPDNEVLTRLLNGPMMEPPKNGYYAPSEDARMAEHVLKVFGGTWVSTTEQSEPGKLYEMPKVVEVPPDVAKFAWDSFTIIKKPKAKPVEVEAKADLSYRARLRTYDGFDLGGPGSGNFGHAGRPGEVGGSAEGSGSVTSSPKFKEWFKKSKVVDVLGKPKVVYHGTTGDVDAFDEPSSENTANFDIDSGVGIFFASASEAKFFTQTPVSTTGARSEKHLPGSNLIPAYVSIQNPKVYETQSEFRQAVRDTPYPFGRRHLTGGDILREELTKEGHDGIVIRNSQMEGKEGDEWYIAFKPEQIKSAIGNVGSYDPANPDIAMTYRERLVILLGGEGSGNFGHAGRPGEVGGSASEGDGGGSLKAETEPGGRLATVAQRQSVQLKVEERLRRLLPGTLGSATISHPTPQLIRTGERTADVLEEMKAKGMTMPDQIMILGIQTPKLNAAVRSRPDARTLIVNIPESLPDDVSLDDATAAVFAHPSKINPKTELDDPEYESYDMFAVRTLKDVIVHEMGHVQHGHRPTGVLPGSRARIKTGPVEDWGKRTPQAKAVLRAAARVSTYAMKNKNEFMAEAFTRLYRGEKLPDDSMALYKKLKGPKVNP